LSEAEAESQEGDICVVSAEGGLDRDGSTPSCDLQASQSAQVVVIDQGKALEGLSEVGAFNARHAPEEIRPFARRIEPVLPAGIECILYFDGEAPQGDRSRRIEHLGAAVAGDGKD